MGLEEETSPVTEAQRIMKGAEGSILMLGHITDRYSTVSGS